VSYDPRCKSEYKLVIIRVMRDQIYIDAVVNRVHQAKMILDAYMSGTGTDQAIQELANETLELPEPKRELPKAKSELPPKKGAIERALEGKEVEWHDDDWPENNYKLTA